jgi:hypothetical protein
MNGFRTAALNSGSSLSGWTSFTNFSIGGVGGLPAPFDAVASNRLVGPSGSHPLAAIGLEELVGPASNGLVGEVAINDPVRIGEAITGRLTVTAQRDISARAAMVRLVGVRLTEERRSKEERDSKGNVTSSEQWVQITGDTFEQLPFSQPALPVQMTAGQQFTTDFSLPAPRLGPVSAHMGSAILAWALEAKWDISMGGDLRIATLVPVGQNIDYLRSGAVTMEAGAMFDAWQDGDATIAVAPLPPIAAGSEIEVTVDWPSAGSGRGGRLELQADVKAPNSLDDLVLWSQVIDPAAFRAGQTFKIQIPADAPPTLFDKGVGVSYRIRALVDRQLRSDLAVERALAVM